MAAFYFTCKVCQKPQRRIVRAEEVPTLTCECGGQLERTPSPPTTQVMETLDNGAMPRRVERLSEAERLFKERSKLR